MVYMRNTDGQWNGEEHPEEIRHIGKIHVTPDTILKMLNLDGGTLMNIEINTALFPPGFDFTVEHPSMPEIQKGWALVVIEHDREAPMFTDG